MLWYIWYIRYMLCLYNTVLEKLSVKLENAWKKLRKLRRTLETAWEVFMDWSDRKAVKQPKKLGGISSSIILNNLVWQDLWQNVIMSGTVNQSTFEWMAIKRMLSGLILTVYCLRLSYEVTCPFSKYFEILYNLCTIF